MGRRRLRLPHDDDGDGDGDDDREEQQLQTLIPTPPTLTPIPHPQPLPPPPDAPLEISDDDDEDFADVPDAFSDPSPPPPPPEPSSDATRQTRQGGPSPGAHVRTGGESPTCPVDGFLRALGLRLRADWPQSCLASLSGSHHGFEGLDVAGKAKLCFQQFLFSDMNFSGGGVLPENVSGMHGVALEGPYVLQVDEMVNISSPLRDRYHDAPAGFKRCLKLSLTDGIQRVYGMEYRPISQLKVLAPAGVKIAIRNVHIRRGLLMLVPEVMEVLGGLVEDLEAARERLVHEVTKPPRGKRKQPILSLPKRASLAAWPCSITSDIEQANLAMPYGDVPHSIPPANFAMLRNEDGADPMEGTSADPHIVGSNSDQSVAVDTRRTPRQLPAPCTSRSIEDLFGPHTRSSNTEDLHVQQTGCREEFPTPCTRRGSVEQLAVRDTPGSVTNQSAATHSGECYTDESIVAHRRVDPELHVSSNSCLGMDDIDMLEKLKHPLILSGDREVPFTYLASLLAKWAAKEDNLSSIQGKIKCFLTGVKGFQFRQRSTYELRIYVDDGSLISEILVDHRVVEKGIGHSPKEVTAALSSSDKATSSDMREALKRFQLFLTNFEGIMLVEISHDQDIPVALEMNQGYSTSDAWLLLRRLKTFTTSLTPQQ